MTEVHARRLLAALVVVIALGCASVPPAESPIDWNDAGASWSTLVVTVDEDGSDRVTRIWLAMSNGVAVFRTNDSRWWANLQRQPTIRVRHDGADHAFDVEFIEDEAGRIVIDEAFAEKYGWVESLLFSQPRGETHENYGRLSPQSRSVF